MCSKEEGLFGSYYEATVISWLISAKTLYKVQYKNLLDEDDECQPLFEIVTAEEVQPVPPRTAGEAAATDHRLFSDREKVDAFYNGGWWIRNKTVKQGLKYLIYFDTTGDEIAYP